MKMEKDIKKELVDFLTWYELPAQFSKEFIEKQVDEYLAETSTNCHEAKLKALHSMKCDKEYCECCYNLLSDGIRLN